MIYPFPAMVKRIENKSIIGLHYLRAIATIMVVIVHTYSCASAEKYFGRGLLTDYFYRGGGEVEYFFIMSGFIMVYTATQPSNSMPRLKASLFLKRRAVRLLPMLWFSVIFFNIIFYMHNHTVDFGAMLRSLLVWPIGSVVPFPVWTIRYEVAFYLIFAVCFLKYPRLKPLCFIWFFAPIIRFFISGVTEDKGSLLDFLLSPNNLLFGIGSFVAMRYRGHLGIFEYKWQLPTLIAAALITRGSVKLLNLHYNTLDLTLWIFPFFMITMLIAVTTRPVSENKIFKYIGDSSYSIFLLHEAFAVPIIMFLKTASHGLPTTLASFIAVIITIIFCCIAHLVIEKKLISILSDKILNQGRSDLIS